MDAHIERREEQGPQGAQRTHGLHPAQPAYLAPLSSDMAGLPVPLPLTSGQRVELWLALEPGAPAAAGATAAGGSAHWDVDWDVRPARVSAATAEAIALLTGKWHLPSTPGTRALVRRFSPEGMAEWEGEVLPVDGAPTASQPRLEIPPAPYERPIIVRLAPEAAAGRLYQRRRSPRLPLGLAPVRLTPLPPDTPPDAAPAALRDQPDETALPVARMTDVSATGAGVVLDCPLREGTPVALEFELSGEQRPFTMHGRIIEPAVPLHGEAQPQPDGLPGFRRGIHFTDYSASSDGRRLASILATLLRRHKSRSE